MLHQAPQIPNYTIIEPLGAGTSGHVWLAKDIYGERRAVKVAHFEYARDPDYPRRFKREVSAQQQLFEVSSHVARIFHYDENFFPPYIVMDYINGIDLNRLMATDGISRFDLLTRLHWLEALAGTLTKAHEMRIPGSNHGIIHRDIKPQNIRIQGDRPYLLDFSISLTSDVEIDSTQDAMTLRYAAPEQVASEASDIFSFGLVAFEILYQTHPLTTYDEASRIKITEYNNYVLDKLLTRSWHFPSLTHAPFDTLNETAIQLRLDRVFEKVFALDPSQRYKTPKEFVDALLNIIGYVPPTPFTTPSRPSQPPTEKQSTTLRFNDKKESNPPVVVQTVEIKEKTDEVGRTPRFTSKSRAYSRKTEDHDSASESSDESSETIDEMLLDEEIELENFSPFISERPVMSTTTKDAQDRSRVTIYLTIGLIVTAILAIIYFSKGNSPVAEVVDLATPTIVTEEANEESQAVEKTTVPLIVTDSASNTPETPTIKDTNTPKEQVTNAPTSTVTTTASPAPTDTTSPSVTPTSLPTQTSTTVQIIPPTHTASPTNTLTPTLTPTTTPSPRPSAWDVKQEILTINDVLFTVSQMYVPEGCMNIQGVSVCVDEGVWIDLEPISNEKYDFCSRVGLCTRPAYGELYDPAGAGANNSVVGTNLLMATDYCKWRNARLPFENEWRILIASLPTLAILPQEWVYNPSTDRRGYVISVANQQIETTLTDSSFLSNNLTFRCVQLGTP